MFRCRHAHEGGGAVGGCTARDLLFGLVLMACVTASPAADAPPVAVTTLCAGCHGLDGGSADHAVPRIGGLSAKYLLKQMRDFAGGRRKNDVMTALIAAVPEGDFSGIAAYY